MSLHGLVQSCDWELCGRGVAEEFRGLDGLGKSGTESSTGYSRLWAAMNRIVGDALVVARCGATRTGARCGAVDAILLKKRVLHHIQCRLLVLSRNQIIIERLQTWKRRYDYSAVA